MPSIDVTALARHIINVIEFAGPPLFGLTTLYMALLPLRQSGRQALLLAHRGLTGGRRHWWRRVVAGLAIPLLTVTSISVSLAVEREIRNGPNRMLGEIIDSAGPDAKWLLQTGTDHFMDTSRLPRSAAGWASRLPGTETIWEQLSAVTARSGSATTSLILARSVAPGMPTPSYAVQPVGAQCRPRDGRCSPQSGQAIVDSDVAPVGARLMLRGRPLTVVAHFKAPASLLNRAVIVVSPSSFMADGVMAPPFAVVAGSPRAIRVLDALAHRSRGALEVRTTHAIESANERFWAGNGTPISMILILLIVAFATVAYFASRRADQEQARASLATLLAVGVKPRVVMQTEIVRAWINSLVAGTVGVPIGIMIVDLADSQILGFHAGVNAVMALSAMSLSILVGCLTALLLYPRLLRLDIPAALNI